MGNGINMILGTPGGWQFRIGSSESGMARGPYPGLALLYLSSAQDIKAGSWELRVMVFWRSIQTPDKSLGENPPCVFGMLRMGGVCARAVSANTTTTCRVGIAGVQRPRTFTLCGPSKFPATS